MLQAHEALERLRAGNARYVAHDGPPGGDVTPRRRAALAQSQEPFAVVLGCSDSRVPVELVFDQGLGDLFVIRVAGNVASPEAVGSVEFAAAKCDTRLVVVLGHTGCGAIGATLDALADPGGELSPGLGSIVERVRPVIAAMDQPTEGLDREALARQAVRANVRAAAADLRRRSELLDKLARHEGLAIVGAQYDLASGEVEFFDQLESGGRGGAAL